MLLRTDSFRLCLMLLTYVQKRTKWKRVAENFHLFRGVCVRGKVILNGVTITLFG